MKYDFQLILIFNYCIRFPMAQLSRHEPSLRNILLTPLYAVIFCPSKQIVKHPLTDFQWRWVKVDTWFLFSCVRLISTDREFGRFFNCCVDNDNVAFTNVFVHLVVVIVHKGCVVVFVCFWRPWTWCIYDHWRPWQWSRLAGKGNPMARPTIAFSHSQQVCR